MYVYVYVVYVVYVPHAALRISFQVTNALSTGGLQPVEGEKSEVSGWPNGSYFLFARNMAKCALTTFVLMSCLDCVQNERHWIETIWDNMR